MNLKLGKLHAKIISALWEVKLGIYTRGGVGEHYDDSDSIWYQTMSYSDILAVLHSLCLEPSDVFVDLGCGEGRVVCCAAQFEVREVIGVEIDKKYSDIAQSNAKKIRRYKSPIRIINVPAQNFYYQNGTIYYLYHPFGAETLSKVLQRIK